MHSCNGINYLSGYIEGTYKYNYGIEHAMMCCDLYDLMYGEIVFEINDECMLKNLAIYFSVVLFYFYM